MNTSYKSDVSKKLKEFIISKKGWGLSAEEALEFLDYIYRLENGVNI